MASLTIHNIDPALKSAALKIIKGHGLTAKSAMSAFLAKVVHDHNANESCFCCDMEMNDETAKDLLAAKEGSTQYVECKDTDDLFKKLGI